MHFFLLPNWYVYALSIASPFHIMRSTAEIFEPTFSLIIIFIDFPFHPPVFGDKVMPCLCNAHPRQYFGCLCVVPTSTNKDQGLYGYLFSKPQQVVSATAALKIDKEFFYDSWFMASEYCGLKKQAWPKCYCRRDQPRTP